MNKDWKNWRNWWIGFIAFGIGIIWLAFALGDLFVPVAFLCIGIVIMIEADTKRCFVSKR